MDPRLIEVSIKKQKHPVKFYGILLAVIFVLSVIAHASLWKLYQQRNTTASLKLLCTKTRGTNNVEDVEFGGFVNKTLVVANNTTGANTIDTKKTSNKTEKERERKPMKTREVASFFLFLDDLKEVEDHSLQWTSFLNNWEMKAQDKIDGEKILRSISKKEMFSPLDEDSDGGGKKEFPSEFRKIKMFSKKDRLHSPCALEIHHKTENDLRYKEILCAPNNNYFETVHCVQLERDIVIPYVETRANGQRRLTSKMMKVGSGCELRFKTKKWNRNVFES